MKAQIIKAAKGVKNFGIKNAPAILTACAVVATIGAVVAAVKGTITAVEVIENDKKDLEHEVDDIIQEEIREGEIVTSEEATERMDELMSEYYTWKDVIESTWIYYIPTISFTAIAILCAIGSQKISARRQAAMFVLYETAQNTLKTYQEKVIDEVGKNKEKKIRHAANEEHLRLNPPNYSNVYNKNNWRCGVENGEALFREPHTGQFFVSTYEKVRRAVRRLNDDAHKDSWCPLSELMDNMGADPTVPGVFNFGFAGISDGAQQAIDEEYLFDPHVGEYMDHEVTIVYMNYIAVDRDKYHYAL